MISQSHSQSEEADQRLIQHTLHCISAWHKIVVSTVDTDVLILLMSYMSQYKDLCTDVNIYAHMVNSACENYDVISAIPMQSHFFMHSLNVTPKFLFKG